MPSLRVEYPDGRRVRLALAPRTVAAIRRAPAAEFPALAALAKGETGDRAGLARDLSAVVLRFGLPHAAEFYQLSKVVRMGTTPEKGEAVAILADLRRCVEGGDDPAECARAAADRLDALLSGLADDATEADYDEAADQFFDDAEAVQDADDPKADALALADEWEAALRSLGAVRMAYTFIGPRTGRQRTVRSLGQVPRSVQASGAYQRIDGRKWSAISYAELAAQHAHKISEHHGAGRLDKAREAMEEATQGRHMTKDRLRTLARSVGANPAANHSRAKLIEQIHGRLSGKPEPVAEPEKPAKERESTVSRVKSFRIDALKMDPGRFQYKLDVDKTGVGEELKKVGKFRPEFAGVILAWKDPADGKTYVVNGHHRYDLARRLGEKNIDVRVIEARNHHEARAVGALANIAEGRGTALDAAKFFRDTGRTAADLQGEGVSLKGRVARDATTLAKLDNDLFQQVALGKMREGRAIAIAEHLPEHEQQRTLARVLAKAEEKGKRMPDDVVAEMARELAATPTVKETTENLFGEEESERSLFVERNVLKAAIREKLAKEAAAFSAVSSESRAETLKDEGNVIAADRNKQRAAAAKNELDDFGRESVHKGEVSDLINAAAEEIYREPKRRKEISEGLAKRIRAVLQADGRRDVQAAGAAGQGDAGGGGRGEAGGAKAGGGFELTYKPLEVPKPPPAAGPGQSELFKNKGVLPGQQDLVPEFDVGDSGKRPRHETPEEFRSLPAHAVPVEHAGGTSPEYRRDMATAVKGFPAWASRKLAEHGVRLIAGKDMATIGKSVGDAARDSSGGSFDGADAWGGYYNPDAKAAVVPERFAARGESVTNGRVPGATRHELFHALDHAMGYPSKTDAFSDAHADDVEAMPDDIRKKLRYYTAKGSGATDEAFAEAMAILHGGGGEDDRTGELFREYFPGVMRQVAAVAAAHSGESKPAPAAKPATPAPAPSATHPLAARIEAAGEGVAAGATTFDHIAELAGHVAKLPPADVAAVWRSLPGAEGRAVPSRAKVAQRVKTMLEERLVAHQRNRAIRSEGN